MAASLPGPRRLLRVKESSSQSQSLTAPRESERAGKAKAPRRYAGTVKSFDARVGVGRIACEVAPGDVAVSEAELVGFEVGDIVSFQMAPDTGLGAQVASVLEAEDEQALERLNSVVRREARREALESGVVDAVRSNDEESLRAALVAARDLEDFDKDTLWLGEAKLKMLRAARELRENQELVHALQLTGTVNPEDELRLQRALHEVKAACAEADAAADSVSFREIGNLAEDASSSEEGEVEVVETDPYLSTLDTACEDDAAAMEQLQAELESVRAEKREAAAAEDYARAARLRRRELDLEREQEKHRAVEVNPSEEELRSVGAKRCSPDAGVKHVRTGKFRRRELESESQQLQRCEEEVQLVEVISRSPER